MQHTPTFADLQNVKRHAKTLKQSHPDLSHTKRLDRAAAELLGVRNFHELNRRYQTLIDQHLDSPGGACAVTHCLYCDMRFAADIKEDQKEHRKIHERFLDVEERTGYRPRTYVQREKLKQEGHTLANSAATLEERFEGVLMVLLGWFERSFHGLIAAGNWEKHPQFDSYVAMLAPTIEQVFPELAASIADRYGRTPGVIPRGQTNWPAPVR